MTSIAAAHPRLAVPTPYREALAVESAKRLRGDQYVRPLRGVVLAAEALPEQPDHGLAIAAARAAVGPDAVLGGRSAAWALGAQLASPREPVEVVLPRDGRVRPRTGLQVSGRQISEGETVTTRLGPATSPARTAFDLARQGPPDEALAWVDAVLRAGGTGPQALRTLAERYPGLRGARQARAVAAVADPRAESPRESLLRWALLQAGLPPATPQLEVRDAAGRFVARLDLGWPEQRVGAEYDGAHHRDRWQHSRDLVRHNRLRELGWLIVQIDAEQWRHPDQVIALLRRLLTTSRGP